MGGWDISFLFSFLFFWFSFPFFFFSVAFRMTLLALSILAMLSLLVDCTSPFGGQRSLSSDGTRVTFVDFGL